MSDGLFLFLTFFLSLGLTLFIELSIAYLMHLRGKSLLLVLLVNVLTNPAVVYLSLLGQHLLHLHPLVFQIPLEAIVLVTEALIYQYQDRAVPRPWLLSVIANLSSWGIGLILDIIL